MAARWLDGYRHCDRLLEVPELLRCARELATPGFDRIETIDEPLVEPAAALREQLGVPGLPLRTARLCRDKVAMKEFLRANAIPCAQSTSVADLAGSVAFAEREGSYVNHAGRPQSFSWAVRPPVGVWAEGSVYWRLLGIPGMYNARAIMQEIAGAIEYFAAAAEPVPPPGVDLTVHKPATV